MNKNKNIVIVAGEPYSIFLEILFKSIKLKKIKKPFILICSKKLLISQMKKLNYNFKINLINKHEIRNMKLLKNYINVLDVKFYFKKTFDKITECKKIAGWVTFVCLSACASSPNIISVIENPKISLAVSNICFAISEFS